MPSMPSDTTKPNYWLNWRFLICALYVLATLITASFVIWKYEGKTRSNDESNEGEQVPPGLIYRDEIWKTSLKAIHPVWLLVFRVLSFFVLLGLIITNAVTDGPVVFYFYTQLTFMLTTVFFGLASALSIYEYWYHQEACSKVDEEQGSCPTSQLGGFMIYLLQFIYQAAAGAVVLTDVVWWCIIYPFFISKELRLDVFDACLHSVNALILIDAILNGMRFPMFRIVYFILWTTLFVIIQWIIHAYVSVPWPYEFMDLSSRWAPLWYLILGLMHFPCYGFFALVVKLKNKFLADPFQNPNSYLSVR